MNTLCIDFGSTYVKYFVLSRTGVLLEERLPFPQPVINDGTRFEVALSDIDGLLGAIFERTAGLAPARCFICAQMHGFILRRGGGFGNYISWRDRSGKPGLCADSLDESGAGARGNLPLVQLLTRRVTEDCELFTLGSYIAFRLTGRNVTHVTDGCATGFFNSATLERTSLLPNVAPPALTRSVSPVGRFRDISIYAPAGDYQVSYLGSGAGDDAYLLNAGTASHLSTLAPLGALCPHAEKRPYFNGDRLFTITGLTGGGELLSGRDAEGFAEEIFQAPELLPPRERLIAGGGGARLVFDAVSSRLKAHGTRCKLAGDDIGAAGLRLLERRDRFKTGVMLSEICFVNLPVILKNSGVDFLIVDNEHGAFDYAFLSLSIMVARLCGLRLIVRLPCNDPRDVTRLADMGATGLLLPMTGCAEDIRRLVEHAKYATAGKRGVSGNRAHTLYDPPPMRDYMRAANAAMKVYAQIENREGVENIEDILSVEDVDGVFIGPNDLACDLDCIGDDAPVKHAIQTVFAAESSPPPPG